MYYKLFTFLLVVCLLSAAGINSQNRVKHIKIVQNGDVLRGDTGPLVYGPPAPVNIYSSPVMAPVTFTDNSSAVTVTLSEVNPDMRSAYDLQSNCIIKFLWQDAANPNNMHAVMMASTDPGPNWTDRNTRYAYSTDRGATWSYLGTVTASRSGFPSIVQKNDGSAIVLAHANDGGGLVRTQLWVDVAPGAATWTMFDPGQNGNPSVGAIWPSASIDLSNNKVLWGDSQNGVDSCFVHVGIDLTTPPGVFTTPFTPVPEGETAGAYAPAVGTTKYGIAFNTLSGGAALMESTNQGATWGTPTVILNWNPADSLGTIRSIDMTYEGDNPRVVIGLAVVDPVGGTFVPGLPSRIVFWGPDINGGTPVLVDSSQGLVGSNPTNDVFLSSTRAVIGKSADGNALYCAWNRISGDTSEIGNDFFDVWFAYSSDHGATWQGRTKVTNNSGPLLDCRYVGISPTNALVGGDHKAYLVFQADSIAASNVNGAPPSISKLMFADITITDPIGISSTSTEVPGNYSLSQNFPNPFNPQTKIKFALPKSGLVTLKLYDVVGREVAVLINEQVTAGTFEYVLNANNLPSGVYFYKLIANDFVDSKKMVLVK